MVNAAELTQLREKLDKLVQSLERVIAVHELNAHFQYSKDFVSKVNKSFASQAFITIQNELMATELLGVCRLWDKSDVDSYSLPSLVTQASRASTRDAVEAEIAEGKWYNLKTKSIAERIDQFARLNERVNMLRASDRYVRTVNHRDKHLAHLLDRTKREKSSNIEPAMTAQYGDEEFLLGEAIESVSQLYSLVVDGHINVDVYAEEHRRQAKLFADSLTFFTKQEFNSRAM